jgi:hypothetical protein
MADEPEWTNDFADGRSRSDRPWSFFRYTAAAAFSCLVIALLSAPVVAQDQPLLNQPTAHFYRVHGSAVKVAWTVEPTTIPEDSELTAMLAISGATNPREVVRPDLKKLPEFQSRFVISDVPSEPQSESGRDVRFVYRLRPRNRTVDQVPMLEFYYFNPTASAGKKQFPLAIARPVPITVTESAKPEPPATPLVAPEELFAIARGPQVLQKPSLAEGIASWVVVGLLGPLVAVSWYWAWRRVYPDAARQATMRRSRAARRALEALRRAHRADDPAAAIAAAVLAYLHSRFPFPPGAATPGEIEAALVELNVPGEDCVRIALFFRNCDAARFAPTAEAAASLGAEAEALIHHLEEA